MATETEALTWTERDIQGYPAQRKELWAKVRKGTGHPELVEHVSRIIRDADVPARDDRALARAVQKWTQENIKYFREFPERFVAPVTTLRWGIGDCDDMTIFIASALRSFRIPCRAKFLRMRLPNGKRFSHVYPQAKLGKGNDARWYALEAVRPYPLGRDPENVAIAKGLTPIVERVGDK
jgi:transglutaminase-like putative cysteine protease